MRKCQLDGCCDLGPVHNQKWCVEHRCKARFEAAQHRAEAREFWCERDHCCLIDTTNANAKFCRPCRCYMKNMAARRRKDSRVFSAQEVLSWKNIGT